MLTTPLPVTLTITQDTLIHITGIMYIAHGMDILRDHHLVSAWYSTTHTDAITALSDTPITGRTDITTDEFMLLLGSLITIIMVITDVGKYIEMTTVLLPDSTGIEKVMHTEAPELSEAR